MSTTASGDIHGRCFDAWSISWYTHERFINMAEATMTDAVLDFRRPGIEPGELDYFKNNFAYLKNINRRAHDLKKVALGVLTNNEALGFYFLALYEFRLYTITREKYPRDRVLHTTYLRQAKRYARYATQDARARLNNNILPRVFFNTHRHALLTILLLGRPRWLGPGRHARWLLAADDLNYETVHRLVNG